MKAHAHRLLINLPDLCASPLVREVRAAFHGQLIEPIDEAILGVSSVFLRVSGGASQSPRWLAFDRDAIESVSVILNADACGRQGLLPRLDTLLAHLEVLRKGSHP